MTRIITVASGKGGVGKTNISMNLALQLGALGHRTCIFDADLGLANINILLGIYPEHTLEHVILHQKPLADIMIKDYQGIDIIPGSSGVEQIANIDPRQIERIISSFSLLRHYDFLIFDTSAGVSRSVVSFCLASSEIIIIITPEPTSLTDAYALLKILTLNGLESSVKVIVNQCKNTSVAKQTYSRFKAVVKKYLSIDIHPLGVILLDPLMAEAVKQQKPFLSLYPGSIASKCIKTITKNLLELRVDEARVYDIDNYLKRFIAIFRGHLNLDGPQEGKKATVLPVQSESDSDYTRLQQPLLPPEMPRQTDIQPEASLALTVEKTEQSPQTAAVTADHQPQIQTKAIKSADTQINTETTEHESTESFDNGLPSLFYKLSQSLVSISDEVRLLRKAVEGNGTHGVERPLIEGSHGGADQLKPIFLDFDKFIQENSKE